MAKAPCPRQHWKKASNSTQVKFENLNVEKYEIKSFKAIIRSRTRLMKALAKYIVKQYCP